MIRKELLGDFKNSLVRGQYNLLFGAGVSLDSVNGRGEALPSGGALRDELCITTGAPAQTSMTRVASLLSPKQKEILITQRFLDCRPGPSLKLLPKYLWRRLFTFNVDDVVEAVYAETQDSKQALVTLNWDSPFEPTPDRLQLLAIHLHGFAKKAESGYVFSASEYARSMATQSPWMMLLAQILATEPFIIVGASLDEADLEYYLSFRSANTPRIDRGPSILVDPNPTVVTRADCKRHGLELFEGTVEEFFAWVQREVPHPPSLFDQIVPSPETVFETVPHSSDLVAFFSDFELVQATKRPMPTLPTRFLYGRDPSWSDIDAHLDVERQDNSHVLGKIKEALAKSADPIPVIILDEAGTGKTTIARRVAHELVEQGVPVLSVSTSSRVDPDVAVRCLRFVKNRVVLLADGLGDHAEQIAQILDNPAARSRFVLLGSERSYRKAFLATAFAGKTVEYLKPKRPTDRELDQVLERYRRFGLVGTNLALRKPEEFVDKLIGEPLAVAVCRIMNDFRPLQEITRSLWSAARTQDRIVYLCVAIADHCTSLGTKYAILQSVAGPSEPISRLCSTDVPLPIALSSSDDDYVIPANSVLAHQVLALAKAIDHQTLRKAFEMFAWALAPHVNRRAIMRRTPEARLAGRLFDFDKVVKPYLGADSEAFYVAVQEQWAWNSRYWEQRALLAKETSIEAAITFARHAVAIEDHAFPLTTLGKMLFAQMEKVPSKRDESFKEALAHLERAIEKEQSSARVKVHPYSTLLGGVSSFLTLGGHLNDAQKKQVQAVLDEASFQFFFDASLQEMCNRLKKQL